MKLLSMDNHKQISNIRILTVRSTDVPVVAARSRLYRKHPIGVGTPLVESLTSYICRVAESHSITINTLITRIVLPLINKSVRETDAGLTVQRFYTPWGSGLNAAGLQPERLIPVLEQLTHTSRLRATTWLSWAPVLSKGNILKRTRMWCPYCLSEWKAAGQTIYEPLIWFLEPVMLCPRHKQPLSTHCPHEACQKTQPPLHTYTRCGYCALCYGWLGVPVACNKRPVKQNTQRVARASDNSLANAEGLGLSNALWVAELLGNLVAASLTGSVPHSGRIYEALQAYFGTELTAKDVRDDLVLVLGNNEHVSAWALCKGTLSSQIECLRKICMYLNITLQEFLTGDLTSATSRIAIFPDMGTGTVPTCTLKYTNRPRRPFDAQKVELALREVLADNSCPPPTMKEVAARLGYYNGFLYAKLPELCRAIAACRKSHTRAERLAEANRSFSCKRAKNLYGSLTLIIERIRDLVKNRCKQSLMTRASQDHMLELSAGWMQ